MNEKVTSIPELFGSMVFTQEQMRQRLPAHIYDAWQQCLVQGTSLDRSIADEIAAAMKEWPPGAAPTSFGAQAPVRRWLSPPWRNPSPGFGDGIT